MSATIRHTINDSGESVLLKLGELVSIRVAPGQMVRCRSGSVWITVDNGGHHHVLDGRQQRSEEHTSGLPSHHDLLCPPLLVKKKNSITILTCAQWRLL